MTRPPVTSEASGVRAPADSFSELADRLVDTGMPWKTPAPTFAMPWPTDSWLTSMRYRWRAANALASPAVWENPISSSATAAMATVAAWSPTSARSGSSGAGNPRGTSPTSATPCSPRSKTAAASIPPATRTSAPGTAGATRRRPRMTASAHTPTSTVVACTSSSDRAHDAELAPCAVALGRRAGELRQLADDDVDGRSGEEARDHRPGEELGDPSHPEHGEQQEQQPGRQRDRRHQLGRLVAREPGHRDRAARDGGERRARTGGDVPGRAEERVDDRARGSGVEPVLQRDARDPRVAEVLGHDQRRDGDARRDVPPQPPPVVVGQPADHGQEALYARHRLIRPAPPRPAPRARRRPTPHGRARSGPRMPLRSRRRRGRTRSPGPR